MTFWAALKLTLKYLPEFIELAKSIGDMTKKGVTDFQVKKLIKGVSEAFKETDKSKSARMLNDLFRK